MKLKKTEIWAIIITLVFVSATVGYQLGLRRNEPEMRIVTEKAAVTETPALRAALPAPSEMPAAPVNLNTATAEELTALSGVGEVLAARIVAYREEHGPFGSVEEITRVSGIGAAIYQNNREQMTVGTAEEDASEAAGG